MTYVKMRKKRESEEEMENNSRTEKVKITVRNRVEEREHFHQDIELIYVLEGDLDVHMGEQVTHMKEEDILVINANKAHYMKSSENILYTQLMLEYHMVSDVLRSMDVIFWCDSTKDESARYDDLRKVLKLLLNHYLSTRGNSADFGHISLCYRTLDMLSTYFLVQTADKESMCGTEKFDVRIQQINNYIRANYNQPISLKDLADKLYLSHGYLSRFFKQNYGMSFAEYLTNVRLFHAVDELLYTSMPITRIAYDNGFANVAIFNKAFKAAYGETPSNFRKKSKEQAPASDEKQKDAEIEERLEKYLISSHVQKEVEGEKKSVHDSYSITEIQELNNCWGKLMNIGTASDLLRSAIREHIILLKEALGIEYVRFWNIFSEEMLINVNQTEGEYNFARLDSILDFLLQHGVKPHIEMGMKPRIITYNVQKLQIDGSREVEFPNPDSWKRVLEAMMRHLVHRYGRSELDTWRMELWFNENKWDAKGAFDQYFELFHILYQTVKKYSEGLMVGGCGIRMDYQAEMRSRFYRQWQEQPELPDFLSLMYYPYDRGEEKKDIYAKRSTDNECFKHRLLQEKMLFERAGFKNIPICVSEWNLTASARNYINDSCFKGAYIIKNVLDVYGEVDDMGFFQGSDRVSEYYDSGELLYGGTGVITRDGILKPAGFAFEFLQRLYPYYIGKGENYLISTDRHDSYGIVCHNQRTLGYNYYFTKEDELEKEHLWKYFEDRNDLELTLELEDVPDGLYQVKYYRINEQNGNVMGFWKEMGYEKELSRNDIKYFRRVCEPKLMIQKIQSEGGRLKLDIPLQANEIAFVRVRLLV